jgi:Zn-dependent metalloprotease
MTAQRGSVRRYVALGQAAALVSALVVAGAVAGGTSSASAEAAPKVTPEQAVADAITALRGISAKSSVAAAAEDFHAHDVTIDADGTRWVHLDRMYHGLPVIGGDTIVNSAPSGAFKAAINAQSAPITASATPSLAKDKAIGIANGTFAGKRSSTDATLAVDATHGTPALVWAVKVRGTSPTHVPSSLNVLVDAATGAVRLKYDSIETADTGTGHGVFTGDTKLGTSQSGSQWVLKDPARGNNETRDGSSQRAGNATPANTKAFTSATNVFGNGKNSNLASAGADAHLGIAATFDFYKKTFNRNGIKNDGKGSISYVHLKDPDTGGFFQNAFWSDDCFCMSYGDWAANKPVTALDVAGHEMTHGVTAATAALIYSGESGGLNEATSDIMGTMVEFSANLPADPGDFLIGEKIDINGDGSPLRYMDDPKKDNYSESCWTTATPGAEVHASSGIGNHFFFLLSNGSGKSTFGNSPTCNNAPAVKGIGRDKAARIWYRALTTKFVSTTDYAHARLATVLASDELFGANSAESNAVKAAWTGVGVKRSAS